MLKGKNVWWKIIEGESCKGETSKGKPVKRKFSIWETQKMGKQENGDKK